MTLKLPSFCFPQLSRTFWEQSNSYCKRQNTSMWRTPSIVSVCYEFSKVTTGVLTNFSGFSLANYLADTLINIARPALGKEFSRVDVYGTNPSKWKPILRRIIPEDQLPEWYGGSKDFRPVKVYGWRQYSFYYVLIQYLASICRYIIIIIHLETHQGFIRVVFLRVPATATFL